ncbi:hypothetical protein ACPCF3_13710 [Enterococcus mundtii]|uniref:hypothetical protein n=1 Tax=Streptomyces angustmyceticus TaxID=285578 RepID=UPI00344D76E3
MAKGTAKKSIKGKKKRFFQLEELLLEEKDMEFVIGQEDLFANNIQFEHDEVLPGERAYIVTKKVVQSTPLYKKQLICLRYIRSLRVVNNLEEGRLVKEVPVAKIIRSNRGFYFIVDRERVTQSYHQRKQRKQRNQLAGVIAEETFRNY